MEKIFEIYIKTTPERLWEALTDPAFTRRYWGVALESDWRTGSTMTWEQNGVTIADPEQVVLEAEPFRRLAYTFHTFTPEFAESVGLDDDFLAKASSERRSKVTFDIEPHGEQVKLTLVHDDFDPESAVLPLISQGWPELLSNLKTLLETGEAPRLEPVARR